jgi:hypothetical protein
VGIEGAVTSDVGEEEDVVGVGVDDVLTLRLAVECCRGAILACRRWRRR